MAGQNKPYRKLSGNKFGLFFTNALWQAEDHLLRVESGMMTERYWRFYFKDIQAIVLHRTRAHYFWSAFWGLLALIAGASFLIDPADSPVSLGFAIFFIVLLAANLFLGPSCRVSLQTAVQVQRLPALTRVRKAATIMRRIREAAERYQGPLDLTASRSVGYASAAAPMEGQLAYHQPPGSLVDATAPGSQGADFTPWLHRCLFSTLLFSAVCYGWHLIQPNVAMVVASHVLLLVLVLCGIGSLARNYGGMRGTLLMKISWAALTAACLQGLAVYILYIVVSVHNPQSAYDNQALLMAYIELHFRNLPYRVGITAVFAVANLLLGGIGFAALLTHKRSTPK